MESDLQLVLGLCLFGISIPSMISAYSDGRVPRVGAILALTATLLIVVALTRKPYSFADLPHAFYRVIGNLVN